MCDSCDMYVSCNMCISCNMCNQCYPYYLFYFCYLCYNFCYVCDVCNVFKSRSIELCYGVVVRNLPKVVCNVWLDFGKPNWIVELGPANSYTYALPIHSGIRRLSWLVCCKFCQPCKVMTKTIGPMEGTTWKACVLSWPQCSETSLRPSRHLCRGISTQH